LECRRDELCRRFINSTRKKACKNNPVYNIIRPSRSFNEHDYFLRRYRSNIVVKLWEPLLNVSITLLPLINIRNCPSPL
jgi:hypothetical protein